MFQQKTSYRRLNTFRLQNWDYGWDGAYFITICTRNKVPCFGKIVLNQVQLSTIGSIAKSCWEEIPEHAQNVVLGEYIIMPNHIHGIIILKGNSIKQPYGLRDKNICQKRQQHQGKNTISSIIGSFKSAVSKHSHRLGYDFGWQIRFYDSIIWDDDSYRRITAYIINNPRKWGNDMFNVDLRCGTTR